MANIKSQVKRNRSNERRRQRNLAARSELKTRVKTARQSIDEGSDDAADTVRHAQKRLDMAAAKGRIHKKQASRRVSRLMKRANIPTDEQ
jgi:small subunit ribosomal protein S20